MSVQVVSVLRSGLLLGGDCEDLKGPAQLADYHTMASTEQYRTFLVTCYAEPVPASDLVEKMLRAPTLRHEGRAGIRILDVGGKKLACRKYSHGGLFRAFTRDVFFSARRSAQEAEVMLFLKRSGFPVVTPFATITELGTLRKRLYLCTLLEEGALNLLEYLKRSGKRARLRAAKRFGELLWELEKAGIYHPDLHLKNVVLTLEGHMLFLDFDKASKRSIEQKQVKSMFWRLGRYVDKMQGQGELRVDEREKMLCLRTYERLSKRSIIGEMQRQLRRKTWLHKAGWFFESLFYGKSS
ncbi:MAG: lipopolysaccharide kinase InaA family protein [Syntrophorhabdales bacterium]